MHYAKIANRAEFAILQHNGRALNNHKNENIDIQKSKYNKDLMAFINPADHRLPYEKFQDRLKVLSYRKQKNNVRMCEIVITAPKNLAPKDYGLFFKTALKELAKQVGGYDNIVAAYVHFDELTPHMHVDFVPGIEVDGVLKLSAQRLIDRNKLKELHPSMQKAIDTEFGHHNYLVVADDPADRAQSSERLQAFKTAKDKLDKLKAMEDELNLQYQSIKASYDKAFSKLISIQAELDKHNKELDNRDGQISALNSYIESLNKTIERLQETIATNDQKNQSMLQYGYELHAYLKDRYEQAVQAGVADLELATRIIQELEPEYPDWVAELRGQIEMPLHPDSIDWDELEL